MAVLVLILLGLAPAGAVGPGDDQPVPVRSGEHPGFGRIVFDFPAPVSWHLTREGEQVTVQFDPARVIAAAPTLPRNVIAMVPSADGVTVTVARGARLRTMQLQNKLVLDVLDPPGVAPEVAASERTRPAAAPIAASNPIDRHDSIATRPAATAAAAPVAPANPIDRHDSSAIAPSATVAAAPPAPAPAGQMPPSAPPAVSAAGQRPAPGPAPMTLAAAKVSTPLPPTASAVLFPFEGTVGAAAFRRHGKAVVVFDEARPLDLTTVHDDPIFGAAVVHVLPGATMVLFPLAPGMRLTLRYQPDGWRVTAEPAQAMAPTVTPQERGGGLVFPIPDPGRTVSIVDPDSGATVLVGTERRPGPAIVVGRRAPQFALWPSWQGVVIEPLSDRLALQARPAGFTLALESGTLAITPETAGTEAMAGAVGLTRRFDLPALPIAALAAQLRRRVSAAATAPPLSRGRKLEAVAATMIALGMGVEAAAELRLAALAAPREADRPEHIGLAAIAALLAWRPEQAGAIDDPRLSGSDEVTLWRAVRDAELGTATPKAASEFAVTWPLILTYRRILRQRLLPLAAETMVAGGALRQAGALLSRRPNDPALALARGMLSQAEGRTDAALAIYDALSSERDRLVRVRAARRAVELRLAGGKITVAQAADQLDKLLLAWRGDDRELSLRERLAELRAQAGGWRSALALLRATAHEFADHGADIHRRMQRIFTAALADPRSDALPPLEFVALVDENTDLLPAGPEADALAARLADRLLALELPERAEPLLQKLVRAAAAGAGRAGIGARLAALRLRQGDAAGALAALSESAADNLPAALTESRTLVLAEAEARNGDVASAVAALSALGTAAADEKRAGILERAQNWAAAEGALKDYVAKTVPDAGELDEAQRRTLIRLAAAAARIGDQTELTALRVTDDRRMGTGPLADMFRLLTAAAVRGVADLRRSGQEAVLAHALPEDLKAVR